MSGPRLSVIPAWALDKMATGEMKPMDLRILCALGTFTNDAGWARVRQFVIAEKAGTDRSEANRSIGRLVKLGLVEKHAGNHRAAPSSYRVILDPKTPPPDSEAGDDEDNSGVRCSAHRDVRTERTRDVRTERTPKNESSNESPLTPQSDQSGEDGARTGSPASDGNGRAAGSPDGSKTAGSDFAASAAKPARSAPAATSPAETGGQRGGTRQTGKRRRRAAPPAPPPPPAVTLSEIQPELAALPPADRAVLIAALNGHQKPGTVRGLIGRFTVTRSRMDGSAGDLSISVFDGGTATRPALTGAAEHLNIPIRCWSPDGVERACAKERIEIPASDPWGVDLKPEIVERLNDAA